MNSPEVRVWLGLPTSALMVMLGVVFVVNGHRYGPAGIVGGLALLMSGIYLGRRCFRTSEPAPRDPEPS